jgi:beta-xylosidase
MKIINKPFLIILLAIFYVSCGNLILQKSKNSLNSRENLIIIDLKNPLIPGYFADPSILAYEGKFYIYSTVDPWGMEFLSCWESNDLKNWTYTKLNWPTKEACTSPTSTGSMVWAPSVIKKGNLFYMYVSVGSEVWCGIARHPLGPWENMLEDKPLISFDKSKYYHVIDAEVFVDDDEKTYLYWGSGWDWKNGHCFAAELNEDMRSFKTEKIEVTPANYFEGPFMVKHNSKYYLTYSDGKTIDDSYKVRYAVGNSPLGPFLEADNSPILKTDSSRNVFGPGHHTIFTLRNKHYILYHRHSLPFINSTAMRQICIDELKFEDVRQEIKKIIPTEFTQGSDYPENKKKLLPSVVRASSENEPFRAASNTIDGNYATFWQAKNNDTSASLIAEFPRTTNLNNLNILFEFPWIHYLFKVEGSTDGENWVTTADYSEKGISGSPVSISLKGSFRFIRLRFDKRQQTNPGIWEWYFK